MAWQIRRVPEGPEDVALLLLRCHLVSFSLSPRAAVPMLISTTTFQERHQLGEPALISATDLTDSGLTATPRSSSATSGS